MNIIVKFDQEGKGTTKNEERKNGKKKITIIIKKKTKLF